jgi:hypothetical protein
VIGEDFDRTIWLHVEESSIGIADDQATARDGLDPEWPASGVAECLRFSSIGREPDDATVGQTGDRTAFVVEGDVFRPGASGGPESGSRQPLVLGVHPGEAEI